MEPGSGPSGTAAGPGPVDTDPLETEERLEALLDELDVLYAHDDEGLPIDPDQPILLPISQYQDVNIQEPRLLPEL
eukprot:11855380-Prorocentrum_lima.AAC.1